MMYNERIASYPANEQEWLEKQIAEFWEWAEDTYEYTDNFRVARAGVEEELADYEAIRERGCAGFLDWEFAEKSPCGFYYKWGFNFGN